LKARPLLRIRYGSELGERGLEVCDDFGGDDVIIVSVLWPMGIE